METLRHSQMRAASSNYYHTHASDIIKHKTLLKIRQCGRVPRESTLAKHGFDKESVENELMLFAHTHPETKAGRKIVATRPLHTRCAWESYAEGGISPARTTVTSRLCPHDVN